MNIQSIVKQDLERDGFSKPLQVKEIFYTLQGEGPFSGTPAVFVRFAECNLRCYWCDTTYNTKYEYKALQLVKEIERLFKYHNCGLVVLTGGEPFRQNIVPLIDMLFPFTKVQIETNGTLWNDNFYYGKATIVCSPKTSKVHPRFAKALHHVHWKYVISVDNIEGSEDGLPLLSTQQKRKDNRLFRPDPLNEARIWVSPMDEKEPLRNRHNANLAAEICMKHGYRLSLQTHKIVDLP